MEQENMKQDLRRKETKVKKKQKTVHKGRQKSKSNKRNKVV